MHTQRIEAFFAEMSGEARTYYFPVTGRERLSDIGEESFLAEYDVRHSKTLSPCMACPDNDSAPSRKQRDRLKSDRMFSFIIPKQEAESFEPTVTDLEPDERTKAIMEEFDALMEKHGAQC